MVGFIVAAKPSLWLTYYLYKIEKKLNIFSKCKMISGELWQANTQLN